MSTVALGDPSATSRAPDVTRSVTEHPGWLLASAHPVIFSLLTVFGAAAVGAAGAYKPLDGVALLLAIAAGLAVLSKPAIGSYLLVGLVPITAGFQRGVPVPAVRLSEAIIGGIGVTLLLFARADDTPRWRMFDWTLLAFAGAWFALGLFDALSLHTGTSIADLETLAGQLQYVLLFRAVAVGLRSARERHVAISLLLIASIPVSVLALLQTMKIHAIESLLVRITGGNALAPTTFHVFFRATSVFNQWTLLSGYLAIILIVGIACLVQQVPLPGLTRRSLALLLLLDAIALMFTAEISALGGLLAAVVLIGYWSRKGAAISRWMVVGIVVVAAVGGSYFASRLATEFYTNVATGRAAYIPQTIAYRWQIWTSQYFPAIASRPVTGWGSTLPSYVSWPYPESQYVATLMAGGVPLLALFGLEMLALYLWARSEALRELDALQQALGIAIAAIVLILVPMDAIFPYFTSGGLPEPLFCAAGVLAAYGASNRAPRSDDRQLRATPEPSQQGGPVPATSSAYR